MINLNPIHLESIVIQDIYLSKYCANHLYHQLEFLYLKFRWTSENMKVLIYDQSHSLL